MGCFKWSFLNPFRQCMGSGLHGNATSEMNNQGRVAPEGVHSHTIQRVFGASPGPKGAGGPEGPGGSGNAPIAANSGMSAGSNALTTSHSHLEDKNTVKDSNTSTSKPPGSIKEGETARKSDDYSKRDPSLDAGLVPARGSLGSDSPQPARKPSSQRRPSPSSNPGSSLAQGHYQNDQIDSAAETTPRAVPASLASPPDGPVRGSHMNQPYSSANGSAFHRSELHPTSSSGTREASVPEPIPSATLSLSPNGTVEGSSSLARQGSKGSSVTVKPLSRVPSQQLRKPSDISSSPSDTLAYSHLATSPSGQDCNDPPPTSQPNTAQIEHDEMTEDIDGGGLGHETVASTPQSETVDAGPSMPIPENNSFLQRSLAPSDTKHHRAQIMATPTDICRPILEAKEAHNGSNHPHSSSRLSEDHGRSSENASTIFNKTALVSSGTARNVPGLDSGSDSYKAARNRAHSSSHSPSADQSKLAALEGEMAPPEILAFLGASVPVVRAPSSNGCNALDDESQSMEPPSVSDQSALVPSQQDMKTSAAQARFSVPYDEPARYTSHDIAPHKDALHGTDDGSLRNGKVIQPPARPSPATDGSTPPSLSRRRHTSVSKSNLELQSTFHDNDIVRNAPPPTSATPLSSDHAERLQHGHAPDVNYSEPSQLAPGAAISLANDRLTVDDPPSEQSVPGLALSQDLTESEQPAASQSRRRRSRRRGKQQPLSSNVAQPEPAPLPKGPVSSPQNHAQHSQSPAYASPLAHPNFPEVLAASAGPSAVVLSPSNTSGVGGNSKHDVGRDDGSDVDTNESEGAGLSPGQSTVPNGSTEQRSAEATDARRQAKRRHRERRKAGQRRVAED